MTIGRAVASLALFLAFISVSRGCGICGTCGAGSSGAEEGESVDGVFWHHDGADFGLCEADVGGNLYHGNICFVYSDASRKNNFCMLDNSHVYYWDPERDDPESQVHFLANMTK